MRMPSPKFALLAVALVSACGSPDLTLAGGEQSADAPRGAAAAAPSACVNFNVPALGAVFGAPIPNAPGSVVWVESAIPVSVNRFFLIGGGTTYNWLRIEPAPASFTLASGPTGHTNNINTGYDFTGLPFTAKTVVFRFLHLGGYENLSVNGSPPFIGPLTAPPAAVGGIAVASASVAVPGGAQGTITLSGGAISKIMVGGQELWLDSVCAFP